jgi:hypothetical protein
MDGIASGHTNLVGSLIPEPVHMQCSSLVCLRNTGLLVRECEVFYKHKNDCSSKFNDRGHNSYNTSASDF